MKSGVRCELLLLKKVETANSVFDDVPFSNTSCLKSMFA